MARLQTRFWWESPLERHEEEGSFFRRAGGGSGALETNTGTSNED